VGTNCPHAVAADRNTRTGLGAAVDFESELRCRELRVIGDKLNSTPIVVISDWRRLAVLDTGQRVDNGLSGHTLDTLDGRRFSVIIDKPLARVLGLNRREMLQYLTSLLALHAQYADHDLCNGRASVCLSVCLSRRSTAAAACGGFAAEHPAGRKYRSTAADALRAPCSRHRRSAATAPQQMMAA